MATAIEEAVRMRLSGDTECYGHCGSPARHHMIDGEEGLIACFSCDAGYVSFIVMYARDIDAGFLKSFVAGKTERMMDVVESDIRIATRHPWEMGLEESSDGGIVLREVYWRQHYRRTKSDDPARAALFRCTSCSSLFTQPLNAGGTLCARCGGGSGKR